MGRKMHPNSLANLDPAKTFATDNEVARMAQKKSVEARKANKLKREALKQKAQEIKDLLKAVSGDEKLTALEVLKVRMMHAIDEQDWDTAADIATKIAPYEAPKLQAVEQTNKDVSASELTDDELDARLKALLEKKDK